MYRNTVAPRLDGRNGFVFKVLTRPQCCAQETGKMKAQWQEEEWKGKAEAAEPVAQQPVS